MDLIAKTLTIDYAFDFTYPFKKGILIIFGVKTNLLANQLYHLFGYPLKEDYGAMVRISVIILTPLWLL
jgi:hypothetical protein